MLTITHATPSDKRDYFSLDTHMPESEYEPKIRDKRCYIVRDSDCLAGIMRYNLFWDTIPFLTLIYLDEAYRGRNIGTQAMGIWEDEMRSLGYKMLMTSTQVDENAQHFYRKLGYKDSGCLILDTQPLEIILTKSFKGLRSR